MRKLFCIVLALCLGTVAFAQKADLRRGNRQFRKEKYAEADISYRKGLMQDTTSVAAHYNLANNLYRQENFDEAARQMEAVQLTAGEAPFAADYYYNCGDIAIARQDWQTAVNMFKESLRRNPSDLCAKENYLYARNKLQEQQNQNQDQNQQQNQEDQQQQQQQQEDQQQEQDQNKDQNKDQQQQPQPQPQQEQLSPQQAQQLLQAIQEKEKQTQEKVDEKKAAALKSRQKEKNW
ncbi:MAG: tetratricopeptide repeat protein [Bacteroidales bacterium]|nr:tetratricopeptide repeat protein [Bacteroidales bacterium]